MLAQGHTAGEQQAISLSYYLYLFFFLGVRVGVLPLEEVYSQLPLAPDACDTCPHSSGSVGLLPPGCQSLVVWAGCLQGCQTKSPPHVTA